MIIVGGGISGLYMAYKHHQKYPNDNITILEKSNRIGGRVMSYNKNGIRYEIGAGRFAAHHKYIFNLIKEFKLTNKVYPIDNEKSYIDKNDKKIINNNFSMLLEKLNKSLKKKKDYKSKTIKELVSTKEEKELFKELILHNEYYSEVAHYSAEYVYYVNNNQFYKSQFYVLSGGLTQLIDELEKRIKPYSKILKNQTVSEIKSNDNIFQLTVNKTKKYETDKIFLAIPNNNMKQINFSSNIKLSDITKMIVNEPLFRIYAKYPKNKRTGKVWFNNISKIVTNSPIKYIIPINRDSGIIMISYTDGKYASDIFNKSKEMDLEKYIQSQVEKLFDNIPKPSWMRFYYWEIGCHYWKRLGNKDIKIISNHIIKPYDNKHLYII